MESASRQHLGLVTSAVRNAVIDDEHQPRRYAVLRVLEVFLEHRHDLLPAVEMDHMNSRTRVESLVIPDHEEACQSRLDVYEYMQLMNWTRKGVYKDHARTEELRAAIEEKCSPDLLAEVDIGTETWWVVLFNINRWSGDSGG